MFVISKNELRQNLLKDVEEYVNEASINAFMKWLQDSGLPEIKDFAAEYIHALSVYGEDETGWNKFRDRLFLPAIIKSLLWFIETTLNRVIKETKVEHDD